jgi:hypothetical protein
MRFRVLSGAGLRMNSGFKGLWFTVYGMLSRSNVLGKDRVFMPGRT